MVAECFRRFNKYLCAFCLNCISGTWASLCEHAGACKPNGEKGGTSFTAPLPLTYAALYKGAFDEPLTKDEAALVQAHEAGVRARRDAAAEAARRAQLEKYGEKQPPTRSPLGLS